MLRVCLTCGKEFTGKPSSITCPNCASKLRSTSLRTRTCRQCGASFLGGPRAWYCPTCRAERIKERDRIRKRQGSTRKLGSEDLCEVCGKSYTVDSGRQRYCKDCAPEAVRAVDRAQSRAWQAEHVTPEQRRNLREQATGAIPCVICGTMFKPSAPAKTCSKECSRELHLQALRRADQKRRSNHD